MDKIKEHSLLAQNYPGIPATDGAGVKLTRLLGTPELDQIDPFLMLDRIDSDDPDSYIAGFPDHPHRGFETVTFIHDGLMRHRDSVGNEGVLSAGRRSMDDCWQGHNSLRNPRNGKWQAEWVSTMGKFTFDKKNGRTKVSGYCFE